MKKGRLLILAITFVAVVGLLGACTGDIGPAGSVGPQGAVGEQGPQGEVGSQGLTGEAGLQGEPGLEGSQGLPGADGADGSDGAPGTPGATGATGSTGSGSRGATGAAGADGGYGNVLLLGVMERAAFRLLATQNADGGWEWANPDTNPSDTSPDNTLGVTAQGMLDAYKHLGLTRLLDASIVTYDGMVVRALDPLSDTHRIRGPDIPFLVELSEVTGVSTYADFAKDRYESAVAEFGGGTATGFAEFFRDDEIDQSLPALISWDINHNTQGALALDRYFPGEGYFAEAVEMAEVLYDSLYVDRVDFDLTNPAQTYYWFSVTGALEAFATTGTHPTEVVDLTVRLLGSQSSSDGGFISGPTWQETIQPTAYAIMALTEVGGQDRAVVSAINYLVGTQELNGGWLEANWGGGTECTEISSEVVQAIYDFME